MKRTNKMKHDYSEPMEKPTLPEEALLGEGQMGKCVNWQIIDALIEYIKYLEKKVDSK